MFKAQETVFCEFLTVIKSYKATLHFLSFYKLLKLMVMILIHVRALDNTHYFDIEINF